ncbi:MAG: DUF5335 family protein [Gemmatimonadota bacterium]
MSATAPPADRISLLRDFTARNTGRITRLEIDDPEIGAQWAELDLPLRGVAYDPRDDRLEIMVGDAWSTDAHLTHSIASPADLEVVRDDAGRDLVLRVAYEGGQALLRLV